MSCQYMISKLHVRVHPSGVFAMSIAAEVCFDELGCFDDLPPWGGTSQRPASILPWNPKEISTRFLLFTQKNRYYQVGRILYLFIVIYFILLIFTKFFHASTVFFC